MIQVRIHMCIHKHIHTYTHIHIHIYSNIFRHRCARSHICICIYTYKKTYIHTATYVYTHTCAYTDTYSCIHTYIYIYQGTECKQKNLEHVYMSFVDELDLLQVQILHNEMNYRNQITNEQCDHTDKQKIPVVVGARAHPQARTWAHPQARTQAHPLACHCRRTGLQARTCCLQARSLQTHACAHTHTTHRTPHTAHASHTHTYHTHTRRCTRTHTRMHKHAHAHTPTCRHGRTRTILLNLLEDVCKIVRVAVNALLLSAAHTHLQACMRE